AVVSAQLGRFLVLSGEAEAAAHHLEHALALAEALELPETFAQALTSKALLYLRRDRLREARILLEGALAVALGNELHQAAFRAYNNLLVVLDASEELKESLRVLAEALELARRVGDRGNEALFLGGSASSLLLMGRWDEGLVRAEEAMALARTTFARAN